ncbi:hypothetical protein ZWY2020_029529 [Hordeum vulgare]|nr:hypothetical protein ZWY2020_029529 [Hordeum vulgare]
MDVKPEDGAERDGEKAGHARQQTVGVAELAEARSEKSIEQAEAKSRHGSCSSLLLGLAARAPLLLLAAQTLGGYSMAKPSTIWINNDGFFESHNRYSRDIVAIAQSQAHSGIASDIAAGFFVSPLPCSREKFSLRYPLRHPSTPSAAFIVRR